jgi:hypothetical protein
MRHFTKSGCGSGGSVEIVKRRGAAPMPESMKKQNTDRVEKLRRIAEKMGKLARHLATVPAFAGSEIPVGKSPPGPLSTARRH